MMGCKRLWETVTKVIFAKSGRIKGRTAHATVSDQLAPETSLKTKKPIRKQVAVPSRQARKTVNGEESDFVRLEVSIA